MQPIRTAAEGARTLESILLKQLIQDSGAFRGMSQAGGKIYGEMFLRGTGERRRSERRRRDRHAG